jgi:hypothetical protein
MARQALGQRGRRHPAGRAAADDDYPADRTAMRFIVQLLVSRVFFICPATGVGTRKIIINAINEQIILLQMSLFNRTN